MDLLKTEHNSKVEEPGKLGGLYVFTDCQNTSFHWDTVCDGPARNLLDGENLLYLGNGFFFRLKWQEKMVVYRPTYQEFDEWFKLVQEPDEP